MTIDWFTFTAQILNFMLLVWLLKRFLYGPVMDAMDQREAEIARRLNEAEEARQAAAEREEQFRQETEELSRLRETKLAAAQQEVEQWRSEHLREARAEVDETRTDWQNSLARDKATLVRSLQLDVAQHAVDMTRHLLTNLADESLNSLTVNRFLDRLTNAGDQTRDLLKKAEKDQGFVVVSSHDLTENEQDRIRAAIRDATTANAAVEFHKNSDLVCGIELQAPGCKLAWSVRESLAELESDLIDAVSQHMPTQTARKMQESAP